MDPILMPEAVSSANTSVHDFADYLRDLIRDRKRNLRDDLLSVMIQAEEAGDRLSEDELLANALFLVVAGHETTMNLIGNGLLMLLRHPTELLRLSESPALLENAVEEMLRFDSPVQVAGRRALEDVDLGSATVARGQTLLIVIGAANRDPERFREPDRFDIGRSDVEHLTFGAGIHYCLGATLARVEGQVAIGSVIRRLPRLTLASDDLEWRDAITFRGLRSLQLRFH